MERYIRNLGMLTGEENKSLGSKKILVAGCGGLGGYLIELMARFGFGIITAVDGDVFEESNLNRQILSDETVLGLQKADVARDRIAKVNSHIKINPVNIRLDGENAEDICRGHDLIMDGLDNIPARSLVQKTAEELDIPFIHGAVAGWYGQVTTIFPGDRTLDSVYPSDDTDMTDELGTPSFAPSLVASIQVSEAVKVLLNKGEPLRKRLLYLNTLDNEYSVLKIQ